MIIGVPRETKAGEHRISLTPDKVAALVRAGHKVLLETGAGLGSGFQDSQYHQAGAVLVDSPQEIFRAAQLLVKVKEPQPAEVPLLWEGQVLFTFLHLAANRELARGLLDRGIVGIAYETVQTPQGDLPLLLPMSEIAGRLAPQIAAYYLQRTSGGAGKLLGGVAGVPPCQVTVVGAGTVGANAARIALGMGAAVTVLDISAARLRALETSLLGRLETCYSTQESVHQWVACADAVVGAVNVPGAAAPKLVTRQMVQEMRPGSVIIDVAVDQGGSVETIRPTSHAEPVYKVGEVIHYGVPNMPSLVSQTASRALSNATLSYLLKLASEGIPGALNDPALAGGVNVYRGYLTHRAVADSLGLPYTPLTEPIRSAS